MVKKAAARSSRGETPPPTKGESSSSDSDGDATTPAKSKTPAKQSAASKALAKKKDKGWNLLGKGTNTVTTLMLCYGVYVGKAFYGICYPSFPEMDSTTHKFLDKHNNVYQPDDQCLGKIWVGPKAWPSSPPIIEFNFSYQYDGFIPISQAFIVNVTQKEMKKGNNVILSAEVVNKDGYRVRAKGNTIKSMKRAEVPPKYNMLTGVMCPVEKEPDFGKTTHYGRGVPQMQVRLVYDTYSYPPPWMRGPYAPQLYVDEFWMTDDQLVKLNSTGVNTYNSEMSFSLMAAARHRFQTHMERSFEQNAKIFGDDSEEMLQMRDLFANTNSYLLIATMVVSVLHLIFEFLAFKNDVIFFQNCDTECLNKFISVQSIAVGIVMQSVLLLYLWDEGSNIIVLITSLAAIVVDVWKVQRAMKIVWTIKLGFIPLPWLESKVKLEKADDFDSIAMKWMGLGLTPLIIGYACYTVTFDCHKGWYSYFLTVCASSVYSLGFVLMTPQVFINYKHKTVAFLPWRKFIYRAINTFIDDLFAFIIRMPTMHRLSCFRDDIVFIVYLYQRQIYAVDKSRTFDEDGNMMVADDTEEKKDK